MIAPLQVGRITWVDAAEVVKVVGRARSVEPARLVLRGNIEVRAAFYAWGRSEPYDSAEEAAEALVRHVQQALEDAARAEVVDWTLLHADETEYPDGDGLTTEGQD